ncbi:MAG: glycosyltransferase family 2 protein, partial [Paraburkholderia sp.]|uniref:glycosyltransferase family 2 protein n=1 Tax=Paraburkholderia sp. TaxID=1926495 RepID=UPI003C6BC001
RNLWAVFSNVCPDRYRGSADKPTGLRQRRGRGEPEAKIMPKVSIITPTYSRDDHLSQIHRCFKSQDYRYLEWLILDDSPCPSEEFTAIDDSRIRYRHIRQRLSIGEKRNLLVEQATGDIIVHFDDDDFYSFNYVSSMVAVLGEKECDLLNLRGWFLYDCRHRFFGYWDLLLKEGLHYVCNPKSVDLMMLSKDNNSALEHNHLGFGFGWAYRKEVWEKSPFPNKNWNEDGEFALKAREAFKLDGLIDTQGLCLHVLHLSNSSRSFPQYHLPNCLLNRYFPSLEL